jgi:hypothetical protein
MDVDMRPYMARQYEKTIAVRLARGSSASPHPEVEADNGAVAYVQRDHRKVHRQSYWKLRYLQGGLRAFLKANNIRH